MTEGGVSRADRTERLVFPCRRATWLTLMPGSIVSAIIASFSADVRRRRNSRPRRTSLFEL